MKIMNIRSIFLVILTTIGLILPYTQLYAPPASPVGGMPQLSDEDLKFLEELGKQIQKEVDALPTRDQLRAQGLSEDQVQKANTKEKFDEDVKRYSAMSEEELFAEMEKALAEVEKAGTPEARPDYPPMDIYQGEQEAPKPAAPTPAPKSTVPSNKQQAAIQLIDALLSSITNFLSKSQVMVELPGKITSWVKEGKLKNWPANLTWNTFRAQIEELQAKLNKIKDKDAKTGTYKYLDDLIKDENTYTNLVKIKDSLARSEPKIALGSFAIDKMSSSSRQAIRDTLLSLHEAVSTLAISASLDKIIEKYEPTAKKIKESEEAAQKRALEESRRGRSQGYTTVGGYPKADRDYRGRYDFDRGGGSYSPGLFEAPEREKARPDEKKDTKAGASGAAGGAAKTDAKKPEDKKPAEQQGPKKYETDKKAEEFEKAFNKALEEFKDIYEGYEGTANFKQLIKHIQDGNTPIDNDLLEQLKTGTKLLRQANTAARKMKGYISKLSTDAQKKGYRKAIRDGFKEYRSDLDKLIVAANDFARPNKAIITAKYGAGTVQLLNVQMKYFAYSGGKEFATELNTVVANAKAAAGAGVPLTGDAKKVEDLLADTSKLPTLDSLKEAIQTLKKSVDEV